VKVKIQIVVESDNGDSQVVQEIMQIERGALQPENLGLKLAEAKTLLQNLQHTLAEQQVAEYSQQQELCLHCSKKLLHKDKRTSCQTVMRRYANYSFISIPTQNIYWIGFTSLCG
jgi:hypothetical protein